jgi:hypothetical protein
VATHAVCDQKQPDVEVDHVDIFVRGSRAGL